MGVSGGAERRAGAIHQHSADKYGSPQNRAVHAWKQWLMNKQQATQEPENPANKQNDTTWGWKGQEGSETSSKQRLLYANNMQ